MSRKPNFDVNVDGRANGRTYGRTEIWTPISHPAISRCDKKEQHTKGEKFNKDETVQGWFRSRFVVPGS